MIYIYIHDDIINKYITYRDFYYPYIIYYYINVVKNNLRYGLEGS